jgi:hypothetical protein
MEYRSISLSRKSRIGDGQSGYNHFVMMIMISIKSGKNLKNEA